jgi:hypothetical protein
MAPTRDKAASKKALSFTCTPEEGLRAQVSGHRCALACALWPVACALWPGYWTLNDFVTVTASPENAGTLAPRKMRATQPPTALPARSPET